MEKMEMSEKNLRKIIREVLYKEKYPTFYVANSSYFDTHPYDVNSIVKAVRASGGQNIRTEPSHGWSNQPDVVVFESAEDMVEDIAAEVSRALGTEWVHIRDKDW